MQVYEGYLEDGQFFPNMKNICITGRRKVIVTVLDDVQNMNFGETEKKKVLRHLRGSCKDSSMLEPAEASAEHDIPRRYDLI